MGTRTNRLISVVVAICLLVFPLLAVDSAAAALHPALEKGEAYEYLRSHIEMGENEINVLKYELTISELQAIMKDLLVNDPEIFYLLPSYRYSYSGDMVRTVLVSYSPTGDELIAAKAQFAELAQELYALGNENWSDLETALFYHDYLAAYYEYDLTYSISDAYGFLTEKKGVCQAYTLLYMLLMEHFGVPCTYASSENMNHIWNVVFIDGAWYHVDVTHDDPIKDRPGQAYHKYFLTGSQTTAELKPNATDMVLGADIPISKTDHPVCDMLRETRTPFVELQGKWYGILVNGTSSAVLSEVDLDARTKVSLKSMSVKWAIPGSSSYYTGCYSGLCTDGRYLYYHDDSEVFLFDPARGETRSMGTCASDTSIYGLRLESGQLVIYVATSPNGSYTRMVLNGNIPIYYTITWVIGETSVITYAEEGTNPLDSFRGSTEIREEGKIYTFIGWSPELAPVTGNATYTALYRVELLYTPGDVNGDGSVNIMDVTALLNYLADPGTSVNPYAIDPDGNGQTDISDATVLLNYLSDSSVVLH